MEFYMLFKMKTKNDVIISTNVQYSQEKEQLRGFIDFYINSSLKFGIEFLRENSKFVEHLNRFTNGGKYSNLFKSSNQLACVNFILQSDHTKQTIDSNIKFYEENIEKYIVDSNKFSIFHIVYNEELSIFDIYESKDHKQRIEK